MEPEDAAAASSSTALAEEKPPFVRLSKAEKRLAKAERQQQQRTAWRQRQREAHRQQVAQREADRAAALESMAEADREVFALAELEERQRKYNEMCAQNARVTAALQDGLRVAVDLYYGSQMNDREQRSLSAQLARCCGINRRSQAPVSLHLASLARCPASCLPPNQEHLSWKVHLIEEDLETRFPPSELIFLSPDSDSVLTTLDRSKVYVIGGLVDISVQKRQTLSRACALGAASARLPLREFVPGVANGRLPLTLPAVLEMLTHVNATGDWGRAIEIALPAREYTRPQEMGKTARRAAKRAQRGTEWGGTRGGRAGGGGGGGEGGGGEGGGGEGGGSAGDGGSEDCGSENCSCEGGSEGGGSQGGNGSVSDLVAERRDHSAGWAGGGCGGEGEGEGTAEAGGESGGATCEVAAASATENVDRR